ncbi:acyl carrier protein [Micromonospora arborensis]|uniref:acyl carrier protein n=1 Tax=Micromonospora arborensis TaxID=2116518 RepID=UPI003406FBBC
MASTELTLSELKEILLAAAGESEGVDLDGDIADVSFADLGYDSLAILETGSRIEKKYGISLEDDDVASAETPGDLLKLVNARLR